MRVYIDENGEQITLADELKERNKLLFDALKEDYENILSDMEERKKVKMGGRMTNCILAELAKIPLMSRSNYCNMDAEDLHTYYIYYMQFLRYYNALEIPSTKPLFVSYLRIPLNKFLDLMTSSDEDLKEVALMIDNDFNCIVFANAESGNNDSRATLTRAKIKDSGQNMVATDNEINVNTVNVVSPQESMKRAIDIAKSIKQIGNKKQ